jgi:hypothetical protein
MERHFAPESFDDVMLCARKFGYNSLITGLAPQRDVPRREEKLRHLLQGLDRSLRGTTAKTEFRSICDAFATVQRRTSMIEGKSDGKLETIPPEPEKMTKLAQQPSQKHPSNQQAFIEVLIGWITVKSISFRSVNHSLLREIVQSPNPKSMCQCITH